MRLLRYLPRFKAARASLATLASREQWSRSEIQAWQLERLNHVWSVACQSVPYYQELAAEHRLPTKFDSLEQFVRSVPVLQKISVRNDPHAFLSTQHGDGAWHRTGGSTGTPMRIFWGATSHLETLRAKYRMLDQWGIDVFDRSAFLWGHSGSIAPGLAGLKQRIRRPIEDRLRNRLRLSAYRLGPDDLKEHLQRIRNFQPRSLYGYSSAVALLADAASEDRIKIPSLKLAIMTAEPADDAVVKKVSQDLGCDAAVEYGSVECGLIATSDRTGVLRIREDMVFVETIANQFDTFDVVVTVLNNPSFPLIRYRIEDVSSGEIQQPEQGFASLPFVSGRQNDILIGRDGRLVHSLAVKHVLEHYSAIRRFCAHQDETGQLLVTIETSSGDELPLSILREKLSQMIGGYETRIELTAQIDGNLAGKHRWIVSDLVASELR